MKNESDREGKWQERASKAFCFCVAALGAFLFFKYIFSSLLPFIIAFFISAAVNRVSRSFCKKTPFSKRAVAVITLFLFLFVLGTFSFLFIRIGIGELEELMGELGDKGRIEAFAESIALRLDAVVSKLSFDRFDRFDRFLGDSSIAEGISSLVNNFFSAVGDEAGAFLGKVIKATPIFTVVPIVTFIACVYLTLDYDKICSFLDKMGTRLAGEKYYKGKEKTKKAIIGYAKAYLSLFLITFAESAIGLTVLRRPYALVLAFVIALVDIVPVFGTGTVLIPWSIYSFAADDPRLGIGLLVLYGIMTIVRQIAEPHIVGESLGVHPLVTLVFMYLGFRSFGITGVLAGPVAAAVANELAKRE